MAQTNAQKQAAYRARVNKRKKEVVQLLEENLKRWDEHRRVNPFDLERCLELLRRP